MDDWPQRENPLAYFQRIQRKRMANKDVSFITSTQYNINKIIESNNRKAQAERHKNTRFLMLYRGVSRWLTFEDYCAALNEGVLRDGRKALDVLASGIERPFKQQEKDDITATANDYNGDK